MTELQERLSEVRERLPEEVRLVAVSKYHPCEAILEAYDAGQRIFGESRVQELQEKQAVLPSDIEWHFIGHLQVNKVKYIAPYISLIHAVDSLKLLMEIDKQCARHEDERIERGLPAKIKVLLQLHVAQEDTKYGFAPSACKAFLSSGEWRKLEHVEIAGVMCMASNTDDEEQIASEFQTAYDFFAFARERYFADADSFCECSWGMSDDYPIAVEHGSTLVRVGSYIFGARQYGSPAETQAEANDNRQNAALLYEQGLDFARHSEWGRAATAFRKSLELDPESPAAQSLTMIDDILAYYHKDNFNP